LLLCLLYTSCLSQQFTLTESEYKNYLTHTFPGYFEIRYPREWVVSPSESIAFSCKREMRGLPVALATGRVIKQIAFSRYVEDIVGLYFTNNSPLLFSTTITGKHTVYFNTPVYDGIGKRHPVR
jgi:hypothetical protein